MEYRRFQLHILVLSLMLNFVMSVDAHSGTGSIVARDTDEISNMKGKLTRLSNLLSAIEDGDEDDLLKVALQGKTEEITAKPQLSAEDMGQGQHNKVKQAPPKTEDVEIPKKPIDVTLYKNLLSPQDSSSIEVLAKALSRLKDPKFNNGDSTGDYLGTENNEPRFDNDKTQEMEAMIARALSRLSQDKIASDKSIFNDGTSDVFQGSKGQVNQLRQEALRIVETGLMQNVLLASRLGFSVSDIIQDMDNKVAKDLTQEEIEKDLGKLNFHK